MVPVDRLTALELFRGSESSLVAALAKRAIEVKFAPDEVVFLTGSEPRGWWIVLEGKVRVVSVFGSRQHVVHTEGPGGTLGEVPLFGGGAHPATGIAAEPTVCALFTRDGLEAAIAEVPAIDAAGTRGGTRNGARSRLARAEMVGQRNWVESKGGGRFRIVDAAAMREALE